MTDERRLIVLAFPEDEADRDILRRILNRPGDPKMPAKYPGAIVLPCCRCGMRLNVGPRSQEALQNRLRLYCPMCAGKLLESEKDVAVGNLGNPDSRPEE